MRVALTAHDFGGVFRMLNRYGLSQRRIAVLPGRVSRRFPTTSTAGGGSLTLQTVVDEPSHGSSSAHTVIRSLSPDAPGWGRGRTRPVHQATNAQGTPAGPATAARHPGCGVVSADPTRTAPHHHPGLASPAPGLPAKRTAEGTPS